MSDNKYLVWFDKLGMDDVHRVGGKNASLGEMICHLTKLGVKVPNGFATTADAYREFLSQAGLDAKISNMLSTLDVDDVPKLAVVGKAIRQLILDTPLPPAFEAEIVAAYETLCDGIKDKAVAVRSSATAEDLPDASFAGQQETYLNVQGKHDVLAKTKEVFSSLFNDRAIAYRVHQGFSHDDVALSVGVQHMVRSDLAASGVMFTLDTESGFDKTVFITGAYGLGEMVVQGSVNPDEFYVYKPALQANKSAVIRKTVGSKKQKMIFKPAGAGVEVVPVEPAAQQQFCLTSAEIEELAKQAMIIEKHYQKPMDIEWAKDGQNNEIYILQARPETVLSRQTARVIERYELKSHSAKVVVSGRAIGQKIGKGVAKILHDIHEMDKIKPGDVLVTDMTDPDWEPIMKRASAIVTNRGGRTCHAAIIARELGIPAIVGCGNAATLIKDGQEVTISCSEGDVGHVYDGLLDFDIARIELDKMPAIPLKIMMNVGNPDRAFDFQRLPNDGVGLARLEFVISQMIGVHPQACLGYDALPAEVKLQVKQKSAAYASPVNYYIDKLAEGVATLAAAFYPKRIIIRFSDFKSNEYFNLIGGSLFEPREENPMIGFRGAARYVSETFKPCFALECEAIKRVRNEMGLDNVDVMIPFVRTLEEAQGVLAQLKLNGLERGKDNLRVVMMCELPTNALLADEYLNYFDGYSIGSNDLTQLTLGLDRDSGLVASQFDERDPAVKSLIKMAISACKKQNKYIGICGQGPSDHQDFAKWLVEQGIDSISLNPDTVLQTWLALAKQFNQ